MNHFALAYDPGAWNTGAPFPNAPPPGEAPAGLIAKINLVEDIVLDPRGNKFTGRFTQVGYDAVTGRVNPQFSVSGQITGQRITP
ncbi:MAG TPA: hypothetical protein VGM25_03935 [Caulobacteraceae bacterium]